MLNRSCQTPSPILPGFFMRQAALLGALSIFALGAGCAAPASIEGVFADQELSIVDSSPVLRIDSNGDQIHFLISEETSETLTVALIRLPTSKLNVGDTWSLSSESRGTETAYLNMSRGDIDILVRKDGTRVVSSTDNVFAASVSGSLTIDEVDGVYAGTFHALLEDGGEIDGQFVIDNE